MSTGRSIHAVPSITPSPREGIEDGPRLRVRTRSNRAGRDRPEDPRRRHQRRLTSPPLPSRGGPQTRPERPRAPHQAACEPPSALSGGDEDVEGLRGLQRASRRDRARHLGAARCGGRVKASTCALVTHAQAAGAGGTFPASLRTCWASPWSASDPAAPRVPLGLR